VTRRTVRLVERRTREVALPRVDADFLVAHARHLVELQPGATPGTVRLTPRGVVGFLDGPTVRFELRPKLPWPNLLMLLGLADTPQPAGERAPPTGDLLAVLVRELADRLRAVARAGLVRGYRDDDRESPFLRGRLRTADQLRDAAARAFPAHFHVTETVFDLDTPWNRVPKAVASALLAHPELPGSVRSELAAALVPFEAVPVRPVTDGDFTAAVSEPRAAAYNGLLTLCRLVRDGIAAADPFGGGGGAFLLDLGRAFEDHLARSVAAAFATRPGWAVEAHPRFTLGFTRGEAVVLQPDLVIRYRGAVRAVLDAKWKRPGPDPADLHQILAYAAVTGAGHVGLVYPGRRFTRRELASGNGRLRLSLLTVPVVGPVEKCLSVGERLARMIRRNAPPV
jgi:5-methylcytosine-specific restriction enzyme subunit McrC